MKLFRESYLSRPFRFDFQPKVWTRCHECESEIGLKYLPGTTGPWKFSESETTVVGASRSLNIRGLSFYLLVVSVFLRAGFPEVVQSSGQPKSYETFDGEAPHAYKVSNLQANLGLQEKIFLKFFWG